jgi:hypothetical protein
MDANENVVVATVANELDADVVCGLLRANGIECWTQDTEAIDDPNEDFIESGPHEVVVSAADADAAKQILAAAL